MELQAAGAQHGLGTGVAGQGSFPALKSLRRWFLVLTKASAEKSAVTNLERQGYRVYYPRLLQLALRRGRWIERIVSLFPRYLFVQLDVATQSLAAIRSTVGVSSIVRFGLDAAVVPDRIVDGLLRRADAESGLHRLNERNVLHHGSRVKVLTGAFEGLEGVFERETGGERAVVLLRILGNQTPVYLPSDFLVKASDAG
jgi:transcriptional antiterminator RfaH